VPQRRRPVPYVIAATRGRLRISVSPQVGNIFRRTLYVATDAPCARLRGSNRCATSTLLPRISPVCPYPARWRSRLIACAPGDWSPGAHGDLNNDSVSGGPGHCVRWADFRLLVRAGPRLAVRPGVL